MNFEFEICGAEADFFGSLEHHLMISASRVNVQLQLQVQVSKPQIDKYQFGVWTVVILRTSHASWICNVLSSISSNTCTTHSHLNLRMARACLPLYLKFLLRVCSTPYCKLKRRARDAHTQNANTPLAPYLPDQRLRNKWHSRPLSPLHPPPRTLVPPILLSP
jgi:hypothetical protein